MNQTLALLAKHTGGFTDRIDHTSAGKPLEVEKQIYSIGGRKIVF